MVFVYIAKIAYHIPQTKHGLTQNVIGCKCQLFILCIKSNHPKHSCGCYVVRSVCNTLSIKWIGLKQRDTLHVEINCHIWNHQNIVLQRQIHYGDVITNAMASQITSLKSVYSTTYSGTHQSKHQSSASLAFMRGNHRWPVNSPHKGPVTWKIIPFDYVIMFFQCFAVSGTQLCHIDIVWYHIGNSWKYRRFL